MDWHKSTMRPPRRQRRQHQLLYIRAMVMVMMMMMMWPLTRVCNQLAILWFLFTNLACYYSRLSRFFFPSLFPFPISRGWCPITNLLIVGHALLDFPCPGLRSPFTIQDS